MISLVNDTPAMIFGRKVRTLRVGMGLSQEALAGECGLHRTYIGSVERGERNVTLGTIVRLARVLQTTSSHLLQDVDCGPSQDLDSLPRGAVVNPSP